MVFNTQRNLKRMTKASLSISQSLFLVVSMLPYSFRKKRYLHAAVADYVKFFEFQCRHSGVREGMKRCKAAFTVGLKEALGQSLPSLSVSGYPKGFPKSLGRLVTWLRGSKDRKRVALTILSSYRLMEADPKPDFSPIFFPPASQLELAKYMRSESKLLYGVSMKHRLRTFDPSEEVILSSGPYGSECSLECALAASSLMFHTKELKAVLLLWKESGTSLVSGLRFIMNSACFDWPRLFRSRVGPTRAEKGLFRFSDCAVDGCSFMKIYVGIQYRLSFFTDRIPKHRDMSEKELDEILIKLREGVSGRFLGSSYLSRITFVPKEGGGSRPVTPTNIFVQSALTPIHDFFMNLTSKQPGDCTFDEDIVPTLLSGSTRKGEMSYSFDWSSATDFVSVVDNLYPVVDGVLGKRVADNWLTLMKSEIAMPYCGKPRSESVRFTPWSRLSTFEKECNTESANPTRWNLFRYAKGAPMGLRSLWPVFATFHHCFTALADRLATQAPGKYIDVPDDIFDVGPGISALFGEVCKDGMFRLKVEPKYGKNRESDRTLCHRAVSLTKGDDKWLKGRLRSYIYLVLCHVSGFKISTSKSVVYRSGYPCAAEFSKRYFVSGHDITPVSVKAFTEAVTSRNALHLYEVVSGIIRFYDDCSSWKKITIAKAASLSFSHILGPLRASEFGIWASCPIHKGRYDDFLSKTGLLFSWPHAPDADFRILLAKYLRDRLSSPIKEVISLLRACGAENFGVSLREDSIEVHPSSPLVTSLEDTEDFVPQEVRSLVGLISKLGSFSEIDFLLGRTPYVKVLEQITRLADSLKRLRGSKRRFIRFDMSAGPVRETFVRLFKDYPIHYFSSDNFVVACKWFRIVRGERFLMYPTRGP